MLDVVYNASVTYLISTRGVKGMQKVLLVTAVILLGHVMSVAQWSDVGQLDTWGTTTITRMPKPGDSTYLIGMRTAKGPGYERTVFEFDGVIPPFMIEYVKGPSFVTTAERKIRVRGRYFISVVFQGLPYPDDEKSPAGRLRTPRPAAGMTLLNEIKEIEWFEGTRDWVFGLNARKPFRIQVLNNPNRVVLDIKR